MAGLVEGLSSLQKGGIKPRLLIIDDGWQCTDVDRELRDPSKTQLPMEMNKSDAYLSEYSSAELEMLRMAARGISTGSSLGTAPLQLDIQMAGAGRLEHAV